VAPPREPPSTSLTLDRPQPRTSGSSNSLGGKRVQQIDQIPPISTTTRAVGNITNIGFVLRLVCSLLGGVDLILSRRGLT
jgi:hypothetical protein